MEEALAVCSFTRDCVYSCFVFFFSYLIADNANCR